MKKHQILIKHHQFIQKGNRIIDRPIKIGDLAAIMICAQYKRVIEHKHISFQLMDDIHKNMRAEILFQDTIDVFLHEENSDIEIYDPGILWVVAPYYVKSYGGQVIPRLNLADEIYTGPELDWGNYIVFSPLFDANYNIARNMNVKFANDLIQRLFDEYNERLVIITNHPDKIEHKHVSTIVTPNLYDIIYIIGRAKSFVGGDTGFSHFAGLLCVPNIVSIYGNNTHSENYILNEEGFNRPFSLQGQFMFEPWITYPNINNKLTKHTKLILNKNALLSHEIDHIAKIIDS